MSIDLSPDKLPTAQSWPSCTIISILSLIHLCYYQFSFWQKYVNILFCYTLDHSLVIVYFYILCSKLFVASLNHVFFFFYFSDPVVFFCLFYFLKKINISFDLDGEPITSRFIMESTRPRNQPYGFTYIDGYMFSQ